MPRLLPKDWTRYVATRRLLQLYEEESGFVRRWHSLRRPHASLIEQLAKVRCLVEADHLWRTNPPDDLVSGIGDLRRLRDYLRHLPPRTEDLPSESELHDQYDRIRRELDPYVLTLAGLAYEWKLRASWAAEELLERDIQKVQLGIFDAARVTLLTHLSDRQIQTYLERYEPSLPLYEHLVNIISLYSAGGRRGLLTELGTKLVEYEQELKVAGAAEPPSALSRHAEWWFSHYVRNVGFRSIADQIARTDSEGGPHPWNTRNAIMRFSELIGIEPTEGTKG